MDTIHGGVNAGEYRGLSLVCQELLDTELLDTIAKRMEGLRL